MPFLSKAALAPFAGLRQDSTCDNVLLEYALALELKSRGALRAIFPVFVGEVEMCGALGSRVRRSGGERTALDETRHTDLPRYRGASPAVRLMYVAELA